MVNVNKIKALAHEQGKSISFICSLVGMKRNYLNDVKLGKNSLDDTRLAVIANDLNTTAAYLKDETDKKEKPTLELKDEQSIKLYEEIKDFSEEELKQVWEYVRFLASKKDNEQK